MREKYLDREGKSFLACDDATGPSPPSREDTLEGLSVSSGVIVDAHGCL